MHEQEFERSVQQKMEELSFQPSAPVWEKVEKGLRQGKKRRRFALWLLPAALVSIGCAFWLLSSEEVPFEKDHVSESKPTQNEGMKEGSRHIAAEKEITSSSKPKTIAEKANESAVTLEKSKKSVTIKLTPRPRNSRYNGADNNFDLAPGQAPEEEQSQTGIANRTTAKEKFNDYGLSVVARANSTTPVPLLSVSRTDLLQDLKSTGQLVLVGRQVADRATVASRWRLGFDVQYGRANTNEGSLFDRGSNRSLNDAPSNNSGSGGFGNGASTQRRIQMAPGDFFSTAVSTHKILNHRASVSAGVRYSFYTLRLRVGEKVSNGTLFLGNASAEALESEALYKPDTARSYFKSHYHLFAAPIAFQIQPFKNLPLETELGLSMGYLAGSKTLRYDTAARLFYVAKPNVQHMQAAAQVGAKYPLVQTAKWQWLAAVQMHYHFSDLFFGSNTGKKLYALSAGIQLRKK